MEETEVESRRRLVLIGIAQSVIDGKVDRHIEECLG